MALDVIRAAWSVVLFQGLFWAAHVVSKHSVLAYKYTVLSPYGRGIIPPRPAFTPAAAQRACSRRARMRASARALTPLVVRRRSQPVVPIRVLLCQGAVLHWPGWRLLLFARAPADACQPACRGAVLAATSSHYPRAAMDTPLRVRVPLRRVPRSAVFATRLPGAMLATCGTPSRSTERSCRPIWSSRSTYSWGEPATRLLWLAYPSRVPVRTFASSEHLACVVHCHLWWFSLRGAGQAQREDGRMCISVCMWHICLCVQVCRVRPRFNPVLLPPGQGGHGALRVCVCVCVCVCPPAPSYHEPSHRKLSLRLVTVRARMCMCVRICNSRKLVLTPMLPPPPPFLPRVVAFLPHSGPGVRLSLSRARALSPSLSRCLSLSHSLSFSLAVFLSLSRCFWRSLSSTPTVCVCVCLSLSLSRSLTHALTHSHTVCVCVCVCVCMQALIVHHFATAGTWIYVLHVDFAHNFACIV